jgi:hypothetical protein
MILIFDIFIDIISHMYRPSGIFPFLRYNIFSLAFLKSSYVIFILLSLNARSPDSVHIAFISAPDNSSFALINSSRFTSLNIIIIYFS